MTENGRFMLDGDIPSLTYFWKGVQFGMPASRFDPLRSVAWLTPYRLQPETAFRARGPNRAKYRWLFDSVATYRFLTFPKIVFATTRLDRIKSKYIYSLSLEDIINPGMSMSR
jgi:hypothetical protein